MKNKTIICLLVILFLGVKAQNTWDKNVVVTYKMTDKNEKLLNYVEVTKDTLIYEWISKNVPVKRKFVMDQDLAHKINEAINSNGVLKFKSASYQKGAQNIVFTYTKKKKRKQIIFPKDPKPASKEEKFIKEFMEPIVVKVFAQELKNDMR